MNPPESVFCVMVNYFMQIINIKEKKKRLT